MKSVLENIPAFMKYFKAWILAAVFLSCSPLLSATESLHPPTLAAHESLYGIETHGKKRFSVSRITMRFHSWEKSKTDYLVECFFLKKGELGDLPKIDDTVLFSVTDPQGTYEVDSKPIKLPSPHKAEKTKPAKKKSSSAQPKFTQADYPREGYIVRLLSDGVVVRFQTSSHPLDRMVKENAPLLDQAASAKSARHLEAETLLKK